VAGIQHFKTFTGITGDDQDFFVISHIAKVSIKKILKTCDFAEPNKISGGYGSAGIFQNFASVTPLLLFRMRSRCHLASAEQALPAGDGSLCLYKRKRNPVQPIFIPGAGPPVPCFR
jgi:hypothetical protein